MSQPGPPDQTPTPPGPSGPVPSAVTDWRLDELVRQLTWLVYEFTRDVPELVNDRIREFSRAQRLAVERGANVALLPQPTAERERLLRLARMLDDAWTALQASAELTRQGLISDDEQLAPIYREAAACIAGTSTT